MSVSDVPVCGDAPVRWKIVSFQVARFERGEQVLLVEVIENDDEEYLALALETRKGLGAAALDGGNHGHKPIGTFQDELSARRAGEEFGRAWQTSALPVAECGCAEISVSVAMSDLPSEPPSVGAAL